MDAGRLFAMSDVARLGGKETSQDRMCPGKPVRSFPEAERRRGRAPDVIRGRSPHSPYHVCSVAAFATFTEIGVSDVP